MLGHFEKGHIPWNKKEHISKICPNCKSIFTVKQSLNRVICCSRHCALVIRPSKLKGKNLSIEHRKKIAIAHTGKGGITHWNWKHGKSKYPREKKGTPEHQNWRRTVFIRDNFTCQDCGINHTYIEAHHIKSWKDYPDFRFDTMNGITLCLECHKNRHRSRKLEVSHF